MFIAILSALWLGSKNGNYWPFTLVLGAVALYWFLEWPSRRGTTTFAIQDTSSQVLIGVALIGIGIFTLWLGFSEFSEPVKFHWMIPNLLTNLIRNSVGSIGVSLLLWWIGCGIIFSGLRSLHFNRNKTKNS